MDAWQMRHVAGALYFAKKKRKRTAGIFYYYFTTLPFILLASSSATAPLQGTLRPRAARRGRPDRMARRGRCSRSPSKGTAAPGGGVRVGVRATSWGWDSELRLGLG